MIKYKDKLAKKISQIAYRINIYSIYLELKYSAVNKIENIIILSGMDRAIGKTYSLVKVALLYDIPIIVKNISQKIFLLEYSKTHFNNEQLNIFCYSDDVGLQGCSIMSDVVLVEEGFKLFEIEEYIKPFTKNKVLIGFVNL